jgi:hypothetical protein
MRATWPHSHVTCFDHNNTNHLYGTLRGGLISLWPYKENNKLRDWKNVFTLHIPPWAPHTYVFVVLTSLTHPRQILFVVLQLGKKEIGKAKDLSAPVRIPPYCNFRPFQSKYSLQHPVLKHPQRYIVMKCVGHTRGDEVVWNDEGASGTSECLQTSHPVQIPSEHQKRVVSSPLHREGPGSFVVSALLTDVSRGIPQ